MNGLKGKSAQKRCFVVMGFGIKTDLATGRQLDLNKSYKVLIKPVVESRGLTCIRADEIRHSGAIDIYMYRELLDADVVIADISTANVNAFYELGIRHALRRRTTIVISEDKLAYPFDLNHIKITSYTHLGSAIDFEEVERFRQVLGETLDSVLQAEDPDSPVYTHLHELIPPSIRKKAAKVIRELNAEIRDAMDEHKPGSDGDLSANPSLSLLIDRGEYALSERDYPAAKAFFGSAIAEMNREPDHKYTYDPYLVQRLAFATYKAKEPDNVSALKESIRLLNLLDLEHTNDPETVTLAGKAEKRLYEAEADEQHLQKAIEYYERGYHLVQNRYHGINLAFLLNKRVATRLYPETTDKIADMVLANRIRKKVLALCEENWNEIMDKENKATTPSPQGDQELSSDHHVARDEQKFWILVNKAEAHLGMGDFDEYEKAAEAAKKIAHADSMWQAFSEEVTELKLLMKEYGHLLNLNGLVTA